MQKIIAYHRSNDKFDAFDMSKADLSSHSGFGLFFSTDPNFRFKGKRLYKVELTLQKGLDGSKRVPKEILEIINSRLELNITNSSYLDLLKSLYQHFGNKLDANSFLVNTLNINHIFSNYGEFVSYMMLSDKDIRIIARGDKLIRNPFFNSLKTRTRNPADDLSSWFAGSLVTNPDGSPKTVYHGSPTEFNKFELSNRRNTGFEAASMGIWFSSDPRVSETFAVKESTIYEPKWNEAAKDYFRWDDGDLKQYPKTVYKRGKILSCYLQMKNPKIYVSNSKDDSLEQMMDDRDAFAAYIDRKEHGSAERGHWRLRMIAEDSQVTNQLFREHLQKLGYDGVILVDTVWDKIDAPHNQYVIFDPDQIRIVSERSLNVNKVDENPIRRTRKNLEVIAYHSSDKNFLQFKQTIQKAGKVECGFHFGSQEAARKRIFDTVIQNTQLVHILGWYDYDQAKIIKILNEFQKRTPEFYLYQVSLKIKHPLRMEETERFSTWKLADILPKLFDPSNEQFVPQENSGVTEQEIDSYLSYIEGESEELETEVGSIDPEEVDPLDGCQWLARFLASKGFDGIIYENTVEGGGSSYIVIDPQKITIVKKTVIPTREIVEQILKIHPKFKKS